MPAPSRVRDQPALPSTGPAEGASGTERGPDAWVLAGETARRLGSRLVAPPAHETPDHRGRSKHPGQPHANPTDKRPAHPRRRLRRRDHARPDVSRPGSLALGRAARRPAAAARARAVWHRQAAARLVSGPQRDAEGAAAGRGRDPARHQGQPDLLHRLLPRRRLPSLLGAAAGARSERGALVHPAHRPRARRGVVGIELRHLFLRSPRRRRLPERRPRDAGQPRRPLRLDGGSPERQGLPHDRHRRAADRGGAGGDRDRAAGGALRYHRGGMPRPALPQDAGGDRADPARLPLLRHAALLRPRLRPGPRHRRHGLRDRTRHAGRRHPPPAAGRRARRPPHSAVGVDVTAHYVRCGPATAYPHPNQFFCNRVQRGEALYVNSDMYLGGYGGECYRNYQIAPVAPHQEKMWQVVADTVEIMVEGCRPAVRAATSRTMCTPIR